MASLTSLPTEILNLISAHLSNEDIKNLRLAGRLTAHRIELKLQRVFLSPNYRNIEVFRAVADHKVYRHQVKEIIWDAALLEAPMRERMDYKKAVLVYRFACASSVDDIYSRQGDDGDSPHHAARKEQLKCKPSYSDCWRYYRQLYQEQQVILEKGLDEKALEHGLERFQNLSSVTITPAAHGMLFIPLYKTPMIRAFPHGFVYPMPRAWGPLPVKLRSPGQQPTKQGENRYGGIGRVLASLAARNHSVNELIVDLNSLNTGIAGCLFDEQALNYENLGKVVGKAGFRRLDLVLTDRDYGKDNSPQNRQLFEILSKMIDLEHICFRTMSVSREVNDSCLSLDVFPVKSWPRLRHFGLFRFYIVQAELLNLLLELPSTIQSIELGELMFVSGRAGYCDLLNNLRDSGTWQAKAADSGIKISIRIYFDVLHPEGKRVCLGDDINKFLYENGPNPFEDENGDKIPILSEAMAQSSGTRLCQSMSVHGTDSRNRAGERWVIQLRA